MQLLPLRSQLLLLLIYLLIHLLLPFFPLLLLQLLLLWSPFTVCNARCRRSHDVAIHCRFPLAQGKVGRLQGSGGEAQALLAQMLCVWPVKYGPWGRVLCDSLGACLV